MADAWVGHGAGAEVLEEASAAMGRDVVAGCLDEASLSTTDFVQPAILACDVAAFRVLEAVCMTFIACAGHSLGEFAALVAAGVLSVSDAVSIVVVRGRAMQEAAERSPGTMTALLGIGAEGANALCEEARGQDVLLVANENSPQQVVISGTLTAIERAEALSAERGIRSRRLKVAGAFHSPLMQAAVEPLSAAIASAEFRPPRFPVASNVSGTLVDDPEELRALASRHVVSPVRWELCARALAAAGADTVVEAGPGDVLTRLAKRASPGVRAVAVGSTQAAEQLAADTA
jgi:[acyl-carrier-protein] S-malonyltransferase